MRSLGESDLEIDDSRFADVDADEWWAPHVERMAELGIDTGCSQSPAKYCPESSVNRGHMAIWLAPVLNYQIQGGTALLTLEGLTPITPTGWWPPKSPPPATGSR